MIGAIAGGIAHAYYGKIPKKVGVKVLAILDERLRSEDLTITHN